MVPSAMKKIRQSLIKELTRADVLRSDGFIGGEWVKAASGKLFSVMDPTTGDEIIRVPAMAAADAEEAVDAAVGSFAEWKNKTLQVRWMHCPYFQE